MSSFFSRNRSVSSDPAGGRPGRTLFVAVGLAGIVVLVAAPVWPGIFTVDSQAIYGQGSGPGFRITNWYSPICAALWAIATKVGLPPSAVLVVQTALVVTGVFAVYRLVLVSWVSLIVTAGTVLMPPVYGFLGWVGRDVWFTGLTICALAGLGWMTRARRHRWALSLPTVLAAWLASDARQNGFPVLLVVGGSAIYLALQRAIRRRRARIAAAIGAVLLAAGLLVVAQNAAVSVRQYPDQPLLFQDLLAVSLLINHSQLSKAIFPSEDLRLVRKTWIPGSEGATIYPPNRTIVFRPFENGSSVETVVRHDWFRMVEHHPLAYLRERVDLELLQLALTQPTQWAFFTASDQVGPTSRRFRQSHPGLDRIRLHYLGAFGGHVPSSGWLFRVWPYAFLGILGSLAVVLAGGPLRFFAVVMATLQVVLQLVLLFTAPQVELRFEAFQVLLGIAALVLLLRVLAPRSRPFLVGHGSGLSASCFR